MSSSSVNTAEKTIVFNAKDPESTLLTVNMTNVTKLTTGTYVMWSRHVRALLEGHELHRFLDETATVPSPTISTDGTSTENPEYAPSTATTSSSSPLVPPLSSIPPSSTCLHQKHQCSIQVNLKISFRCYFITTLRLRGRIGGSRRS